MNKLLTLLSILFFAACGQKNADTTIAKDIHDTRVLYDKFDKSQHIQPEFDRIAFDTLHGFDFGWAMLEPINIMKTMDDNKELAIKFSPGQKALHFFWYLDAEVTNGGFVQFYWNGYGEYIPTIKEGLKLIGDDEMLALIENADKEYLANKDKFAQQKVKDDWQLLYDDLKKLSEYDLTYYDLHEKTMSLIEKYARSHPEEFVKLKQNIN